MVVGTPVRSGGILGAVLIDGLDAVEEAACAEALAPNGHYQVVEARPDLWQASDIQAVSSAAYSVQRANASDLAWR